MKLLFTVFAGLFGAVAIFFHQDMSKDFMFFVVKNGPEILNQILTIAGALIVPATILTRITPTPKDDEFVDGFHRKFISFTQWLPTVGISPRTKELEIAARKARKGYRERK